MKHFYRICLVLLAYASAIWMVNLFRQKPVADFAQVEPESGPTEASPRIHSSDPFYDSQIAKRIEQLTELAQYRQKLQTASQFMMVTRRQAATATYPAWTQLLKAKQTTYRSLLERAKHTSNGQTLCTICDGTSYVTCIMCKDHDGKCVTCEGTGHDVGSDFCPACFGKGKCYLCNGNSRMFCPFCDDGTIRLDWPPPRAFPPLY